MTTACDSRRDQHRPHHCQQWHEHEKTQNCAATSRADDRTRENTDNRGQIAPRGCGKQKLKKKGNNCRGGDEASRLRTNGITPRRPVRRFSQSTQVRDSPARPSTRTASRLRQDNCFSVEIATDDVLFVLCVLLDASDLRLSARKLATAAHTNG